MSLVVTLQRKSVGEKKADGGEEKKDGIGCDKGPLRELFNTSPVRFQLKLESSISCCKSRPFKPSV
jgi:hypothetical protein